MKALNLKYPLSHNRRQPLGDYFQEILRFHLPPSKNVCLLDPTCGKRYLWSSLLRQNLLGHRGVDEYGRIVFSDIKNQGQEIVSDIRDLEFSSEFDGIVFDPPYFFGYEGSEDPRALDYGGYTQTYDELLEYMYLAKELFPAWLKKDGKLIVKCADQYQVKERKFYPHHHTWTLVLDNFTLIDLFIFIHHRMSPTAFQVKDRPSSVIMHAYFLVFQHKSD